MCYNVSIQYTWLLVCVACFKWASLASSAWPRKVRTAEVMKCREIYTEGFEMSVGSLCQGQWHILSLCCKRVTSFQTYSHQLWLVQESPLSVQHLEKGSPEYGITAAVSGIWWWDSASVIVFVLLMTYRALNVVHCPIRCLFCFFCICTWQLSVYKMMYTVCFVGH